MIKRKKTTRTWKAEKGNSVSLTLIEKNYQEEFERINDKIFYGVWAILWYVVFFNMKIINFFDLFIWIVSIVFFIHYIIKFNKLK